MGRASAHESNGKFMVCAVHRKRQCWRHGERSMRKHLGIEHHSCLCGLSAREHAWLIQDLQRMRTGSQSAMLVA